MRFSFALGDRRLLISAFIASAVLATCGVAAGKMPSRASVSRTVSGPPACTHQRTTSTFGASSAKLRSHGGIFCVPSFGGFGGSIQYPGVETSVKLTMRTSTADIYNEPLLGTGTPLVYLNLHFHAGTHFQSNVKSAGGLTSESIQSGDDYTAFGIVAVGNLVLRFPPCYGVATQGPYGGVFPGIGNIFSGTTITGNGYGVIEIYSGIQTSQEC